jgi:acyl carrier protein
LARLIADILRIPEHVADTDGLQLESLPAWDSMTRIELIVSIEDHYGIELSQEDIIAIRSVDDIRKIVSSRGCG